MTNFSDFYNQFNASSSVTDSYVIAEIGNNYGGDINLAIKMIEAAASAGVSCVKFQKRY